MATHLDRPGEPPTATGRTSMVAALAVFAAALLCVAVSHGLEPVLSGTSMASMHTRVGLQRTRAVMPEVAPSAKGRPARRTHGEMVWMVAR